MKRHLSSAGPVFTPPASVQRVFMSIKRRVSQETTACGDVPPFLISQSPLPPGGPMSEEEMLIIENRAIVWSIRELTSQRHAIQREHMQWLRDWQAMVAEQARKTGEKTAETGFQICFDGCDDT